MTLPVDMLLGLLAWTLLNPATILVAFLLGRRADQASKIIVAAFAAGFAGMLLGLLAWLVGSPGVDRKSLAGLFTFCFLYGLLWAWIGYRMRPSGASSNT
jgi:hypothetical protein